jgi:hypothetical protein
MEYIVHYNDVSTLEHLGFCKSEDPEEENEECENLEEFISTIASIFNSLLEGSNKRDVIIHMAQTL